MAGLLACGAERGDGGGLVLRCRPAGGGIKPPRGALVSADFHATGSTQGSDELVAQSPVVPPGHWGGGGEFGFAEDGGVGPSVEADGDGVVGGDDFAGGLEEPALQGVGGDGGVAG